MAEWLGKGLQNPVPGFESRRRLVGIQCPLRALSSAAERCLDTAEVTGSIPVAPTQWEPLIRLRNAVTSRVSRVPGLHPAHMPGHAETCLILPPMWTRSGQEEPTRVCGIHQRGNQHGTERRSETDRPQHPVLLAIGGSRGATNGTSNSYPSPTRNTTTKSTSRVTWRNTSRNANGYGWTHDPGLRKPSGFGP